MLDFAKSMQVFILLLLSTTVLSANPSDHVGYWVDGVATNVTCHGANDGTATAVVYDGTPPYVYQWSTGGTTETITGLAPGEYAFTVTDADGNVASDISYIYEPGPLSLETSSSYATCSVSPDGTATALAAGGTGELTFVWQDTDGNTYNGFFIENVLPGDYTVTVTDENGCTISAQETIELSPESIWIMMMPEHIVCHGDATGFIHASAMLGTPPYTYLWSDPLGQTTEDAFNLIAGTYSVTVTDSNGCTGVESVEVTQPEDLVITPQVINADCNQNNGMITVLVESGVYPVTFNFSNGHTTTSTAINLAPGTYSATVTDANSCTEVLTGIVVGDDCPGSPCEADAGTLSIVTTSPICLENGMATVMATANGDAVVPAGYDVLYVLTTTDDLTIVEAGGSPSFTVTTAGLYTIHTLIAQTGDPSGDDYLDLSIVDFGTTTGVDVLNYVTANGICASLDVTGAAFAVEECPNPCEADAGTLSIVTTSPICLENGMATVMATANGDAVVPAGYDVLYVLTTTDDLTIVEAGGSPSFTVTTAGLYTIHTLIAQTGDPSGDDYLDLSIVDFGTTTGVDVLNYVTANGICASLDVTGAVFTVEECPCVAPILESVVVEEATCRNADGTATINMVGDEADFTYTWTPDVSSSNIAQNLPTGIYSVVITDANDPTCPSITETFTVANADGPDAMVVASTPSTCNADNGTATVAPFGYVYEWCNGEMGNNVTNLIAGNCFVKVTDTITGCFDFITVTIENVNILGVDIAVTNQPDCGVANGSVAVTVTNGSFNYEYLWSDGSTDADRTDLAAGVYTLTVTDNGPNGCVETATVVLTDNIPQAAVTIDNTTPTSCPGTTDGAVDFTVTTDPDLVQPVSVVIQDENEMEVSNDNLAAGDYCIVVRDGNGCYVGGDCFTIEGVPTINVDIAVLPETCIPNGSITLTDVSGGNGGYTFDWADLPGTDNPQNRTGLQEGMYSVTVSDANGCSVALTGIDVDRECNCLPPSIESVVIVEATCNNDDGRATVNLAGGDIGYTFSWNIDVGSVNTIGDVPAGTYSVTITDNNDPTCFVIEMFTIGNSDGPDITIETTDAECNQPNGSAALTPVDFEYTWNDGSTAASRTDLGEGMYQVTIVDPANPDCFDVQTVEIDEINELEAAVTINSQPAVGASNGSATINPTNGSGNYTYSWGPSATRDDLSAGVYSVTVVDIDTECETVVLFVLENNAPPSVINISNISPILCAGGENGTVTFNLNLADDFVLPERIEIVDANGNVYDSSGLRAGDYCALVYDANDVLNTSTCFTIDPIPQIDIDLAIADMDCNEMGSIEVVSEIGGTGDFTYQWSDNTPVGANPLVLSNLEGGAYGLTVTDENGCTVSENFNVEDESYNLQLMLEPTDVDCDSLNNGTVASTVIGATGTVDYSWNNEMTDPDLSGLEAGTYTLTVTDEAGCTGEAEATIYAPTPIELAVPADTVACQSPFVIGVEGNQEGLVYQWTDELGNELGSGDVIGVPAIGDGLTITVMATDTFGCTTMESIMIANQTPQVEIDNEITACLNQDTVIGLTNLDPEDILTYVWAPTDIIASGGETANPVINTNEAGNVTLMATVTNQFNCSTVVATIISTPDLSLELPDTALACVGTPFGLNNGGNENLVYEWSPSAFLDNPTAVNPFVSAPAGTNQVYTVMVSDSASLCSNSAMVEAVIPAELTNLDVPEDTFSCSQSMPVMLNAGGEGVMAIDYYDADNVLLGSGSSIQLPVDGLVAGDTQTISIVYLDQYNCPTTETVNIGNGEFLFLLNQDPMICVGDTLTINSDYDEPGAVFDWTDAAGIIGTSADGSQLLVSPEIETVYELVITNQYGCTASNNTMVNVTDLSDLVATASESDTIFAGESVQLSVTEGFDTYQWTQGETLDDDTVFNPEAAPMESTDYIVTVTDEDGCTAEARTTVTVLSPDCQFPYIFFPNAFTPNDDGVNDVAYLRAAFAVDEVFFMIYNRWGEKMFESNSLDNGWDGTYKGDKLTSDVYAYYLRVVCADGEVYEKKGNISILR